MSSIPPKTVEKLNGEHMDGTKHAAKIALSMSLLGNGLPPSAVMETLRAKFPNAAKGEIEAVVNWCADKNPQPTEYAGKPMRIAYDRPAKQQTLPTSPRKAVKDFVNGNATALKSPVEIEPGTSATQLLTALYEPTEYLNIVCNFTTTEKDGATKANPSGSGATKTRDEWLEYFRRSIPAKDAGAWFRPNPVKQIGSGKDGAITDADVTDFRFMLLESDVIAPEEQLAFYDRLKLPLAAIIASGGKSYHAWLRLDADDAEDYREKTARILEILKPFGIDQANKNASRLSRLAGAIRKIGAHGDGIQQLVYLNPTAQGITDDEITALAARVKPSKWACKPMRQAALDSLDVYEDIYANKHKTGLRTGFSRFDFITGGIKKSWLTIVAGETGAGKTTFVLNIIMNTLLQGKKVALFSFEMDQQEIMDILFARECAVNRNHFNNGYFSEKDFASMAETVERISKFDLHIYDDPKMRIDDVTEVCERIASEGELALIVIDYIQLANTTSFLDNREQQVAYVSRRSKALAKTAKAPVIGVSQLNEEGKMRESRAIEHDANCAIKIQVNENGGVEASIKKGRNIPKGSYYFDFHREYCRFVETGCDENLKRFLPEEHPEFTTTGYAE